MGSWLIIIVFMILLIVTIGILLLLHWDIKRMTHQLDEIIDDFGTNELVRTNTHNKILIAFVTKINQLIHAFKQEQQNMQRREMKLKQEITNISHDLRTPLTSIKGFSELLSDPTLSEAERTEYLAIIQKKIDNLIMMADEFYELSQYDSADKPLVMEKQYLDTIVAETLLMFQDEFEKRHLKIDLHEASVSPIYADHQATKRIVTNLIQNALRYAESYVSIHLIDEYKYVRLKAINDVDGIDPSEMERIFDRTYRFDKSRTGSQLGLGLHIVQQLVKQQGGKVTADVFNHEFIIEVTFKKWMALEDS